MIDSVGRTRQAIEVLAQDLARQENQADAEASPLNLARNEVLISFVVFGLADVPDWHVVETTVWAGSGIPGDQDFCANRISPRNGKRDLITNSYTRSKKTGQQQLGLIGKHADNAVLPQLDFRHALTTDRNG